MLRQAAALSRRHMLRDDDERQWIDSQLIV